MAGGYSWEKSKGESWNPRSTTGGNGFAVVTATLAGLIVFGLLIFGLDRVSLWLGIAKPVEIRTQQVQVNEIELNAEPLPEVVPEEIVPPEETTSELLAEIEELIPELDETELDISPEIERPELALESSVPLDSGEEFGTLLEPVAAPEVSHVLDQIGRTENLFQEASSGQVVIEEGSVKADIVDPDEFLSDMTEKGSGGLSDEGLPSGYASIDGLLQMATGELTRSRAALPSDLLFEYDSADLKETARFGLMKLAMLIDRNPEMYCILEGHTDLYGGEAYNLELSRRRAAAVKNWLVNSMMLSGNRIIVVGYGKARPKVRTGSITEQALNRRVDILMRKDLPAELTKQPAPVEVAAPEKAPIPAQPVERTPIPAQPVEEKIIPAIPVEEDEPLRAIPVEEEPPPAPKVDEVKEKEPIRAIPVE
ncbi:MAG: OmpA family protein [Verrucomicrobiota bacterium JB023]|nr:OmpA family protein [Verrucomicrobiota bacterium JB023]